MTTEHPSLFDDTPESWGQAIARHRGDAGIHPGDPFVDGFTDFPFVPAGRAEQADDSQEPAIDTSDGSDAHDSRPVPAPRERLSEVERLRQLLAAVGFLPDSRRELSLARSIVKANGDFAEFLASIRGHQERAIAKDPEAALKVIDDEVRSFALMSNGDAGLIGVLIKDLSMHGAVEHHPQSYAIAEPEFEGWQDRLEIKRPLRHVVKHDRLQQALSDDSEEVSQLHLDTVASDEEIAAYLQTHTVEETYQALCTERSMQRVRHAFWETPRREARRQAARGHVATTALDSRAWPAED